MKKISLFLCFIIFFMTTAQAATTNGLKQLVDEFNYSIQVEWDQKDKIFYDNEIKKFERGLEKLQDEGLTVDEMMNFITLEVKDQNIVKAIQDSMTLIDIKKLDREASKTILINNMKYAYQKGASWNGSAVITGTYIAFIAVFAIMVALIAVTASKNPGGGGGSNSNSNSNSSGSNSSNGSNDNDSYTYSNSNDSGSGDYSYGSSDSGSSDSSSSDSGSSDSGSSGDTTGGDTSGSSDSDGDGWGDDWDWKR